MYPYLDVPGFRRRSIMASVEVDYLEQAEPGFIAQAIALWSSWINGRIRKRYGNAPGIGNALPFGQGAPSLLGSAQSVSLQGRPRLGSYQVTLIIDTSGALGVATFLWSVDGGITATSATTGAAVTLGATGLTAVFPDVAYTTGDSWMAATPVPEIVIGWLVSLVTFAAYQKRGFNTADPSGGQVIDDRNRAFAEVKEAADSKDGLFDLPTSEDQDSAVTAGGPLGYAEASPYVWADIEARAGYAEDAASRRFR